jgi:hypothetical protein
MFQLSFSWESNPASGRGANCDPRGEYLVQILKIFDLDTNECDSILRSSGYTGMLRWNCPGFESAQCRSFIYFEAFFFFLQYCKDFLLSHVFLLVKNTRKISYNRNPVNRIPVIISVSARIFY